DAIDRVSDLLGGLAAAMSWRGEEGGIQAVKAGHEVIMTPNKYCYIDLKQGQSDLEPNLGYSELLLSTSYNYKVIPDDLTEREGRRIKGIQANLWTESISDWGKLTYMTFPRLYAIAESGWTRHENKDWDDFTNRLVVQLERLDAEGVRYAKSAFSPWIEHKAVDSGIELHLKTEVNSLDIHYTLDGTEPTPESASYSGPFIIENTSTVAARAFQGGDPVGYLSRLGFYVHKAIGATAKNPKMAQLTDLNYAGLENGDPNWVTLDTGAEIDLVFADPTEVKEVKLDALRWTISGVYPPETVTVYGSKDGTAFMKLGETDKTQESRIQGRNRIGYHIAFDPTTLKALRIKPKEISPVPEGHHHAGREHAIVKMDEVVVN
ncbi:MAG: family 20 glycosylhydrolase, partial [Bacteroidota bacterium]